MEDRRPFAGPTTPPGSGGGTRHNPFFAAMASREELAPSTSSSSSADNIQLLRELFDKAEKMVATSDTYLRQAHRAIEEGRQSSERLEQAHSRLEYVVAELDKQLQVVRQLMRQLKLRITSMQRMLQAHKARSNEVNQALLSVFEHLKAQALDEGIAASVTAQSTGSNGASSGQHTSLYDFVDAQGVQRLQRQAVQEIREMEARCGGLLTPVEAADEALKRVKAAVEAAEARIDFRLPYPTEKTSLQLNEANSLSIIGLSVTSHCDQLRHMLQQHQQQQLKHATGGLGLGRDSLVDGHAGENLAAIRKRAEQLPSSLAQGQQRLQRIQHATVELQERCDKYGAAFKRVSQVAVQVDKLGTDMQEVVLQVDEHERAVEARRSEVAFLFDELANLTTWYELFGTAYDELLVEIERRHNEHRRIRDVVLAYQKELNLWYHVETQKREQFFERHGRYLPQSLCPAIMENAPRYEIYPLHFASALPLVGGHQRPDDKNNDDDGDAEDERKKRSVDPLVGGAAAEGFSRPGGVTMASSEKHEAKTSRYRDGE